MYSLLQNASLSSVSHHAEEYIVISVLAPRRVWLLLGRASWAGIHFEVSRPDPQKYFTEMHYTKKCPQMQLLTLIASQGP